MAFGRKWYVWDQGDCNRRVWSLSTIHYPAWSHFHSAPRITGRYFLDFAYGYGRSTPCTMTRQTIGLIFIVPYAALSSQKHSYKENRQGRPGNHETLRQTNAVFLSRFPRDIWHGCDPSARRPVCYLITLITGSVKVVIQYIWSVIHSFCVFL